MIEMLITIAIASVVLTLAIPSFRTITLNNQRAATVNELLKAIQYARAEAVVLRTSVTICRSNNVTTGTPTCASGTGWENGWMVFTDRGATVGTLADDDAASDRDGSGAVDLLDAVLLVHDKVASSSVTIRGNGLAALGTINRITFSAAGTTSNAGSIVYCDQRGFANGNARVLVSSTFGRVFSAPSNQSGLTATTCQT
jgi:type IV fimbrial biogenesis protein FimT